MSVSHEPDGIPDAYKITVKGNGVNIEKAVGGDIAAAVMNLLMSGSVPPESRPARKSGRRSASRSTEATANGTATNQRRAPKKRSRTLATVPDLGLRPKGKEAFVDFAAEKAPSGHGERQAVILYWLQSVGGITGIGVAHVNTCYTAARWTRPADLTNALAVTAHRTHWLDSSNMDDLKLTTLGEDMVDHELPRKPRSAKAKA